MRRRPMHSDPIPQDWQRTGGSGRALHQLLEAMETMREGDFSARLPHHWEGLEGKLAAAFNAIASTNGAIASELERIGHVVGSEGETRTRMATGTLPGAWGGMERLVNGLIDDLVRPGARARRDSTRTWSSRWTQRHWWA